MAVMDNNNNNLRAQAKSLAEQSPPEVFPILAGVAAFGSTLAASTLTQQRFLGISTGTRPPVPTLTGLVTVCLASLASHQAAVTAQRYIQTGKVPSLRKAWEQRNYAQFGYREDYINLYAVQIPLHTIRICAIGLIAFKLLGGRFWAIAPSSYTHLGSFARPRVSIAATERYATTAQRAAIEKMGRAFGCHTCGSRKLFRFGASSAKFVGDHMPPKAVAEQMNQRWFRRLRPVKFRFFPQCIDCSNKQGSILSKAASSRFQKNLSQAGGGSNAYFHGFVPRLCHLTGGVIGAVAVVGANEADLIDGNRWRFARLHRQLDRRIQNALKDARQAVGRLSR